MRAAIFGRLIALAVVLAAGAMPAQAFPDHPIRLVVPWPPGGGTDVLARALASRMSETLGQPVVVDNRAGANGAIGSQEVARARPDGYTLVLATADTHGIAPALRPDLPYDPERDFAAVIWLTTQPLSFCVHPSLPVQDLAGFLAYARTRPDAVTYASWGIGSTAHMATAKLMLATGIRLIHVPYRGAAPAVTDLLGGQVQSLFTGPLTVTQYAGTGRLRCLATASPRRPEALPDIPTFVELGVPGVEIELWYGLAAPTGTPQAALTVLHDAAAEALDTAPVRSRIASLGQQPVGGPAARFAAHIEAEVARWSEVVRSAGITAQ